MSQYTWLRNARVFFSAIITNNFPVRIGHSHRSVFLLFLVLCSTLFSAPASGTQAKVGLVLSGGGARGAAHIGVLNYLEEAGVHVDVVVGTSMGAIVGGLYAAGLSAAEIEAVFTEGDWPALFSDRPPRASRTFRRKQDDDGFLVDFDLGVRADGLRLPQGLIQGQHLDMKLRNLTLPVAHIRQFDELPIPFRAIATDIERGSAVALASGDLATAIRASMSLPGIFKPVKIDDRILVDGGVANNLPISIAREMGADIIIAVDVGFPLKPIEDLHSALDVTRQMLTIMIKQRADEQRAQLNPQDILITPELGDLDSQQFHRMQEAQAVGYASAQALQAELLALSDSHNADDIASTDDAQMKRDQARRELESQTIHRIEIMPPKDLSPAVLRDRLLTKVGEPMDLQTLEADIERIYALDTFESVDYRINESADGLDLTLRAQEKSWGPHYLRFGINLEDDFSGNNAYNLAARHTWTALNRLGAELRTEAQIGNLPYLKLDFYQPLDTRGRWFINPHWQIGREASTLFFDQVRVAEFSTREVSYGVDVGRELGQWGEFRVGLIHEDASAQVRVGLPGFGNEESTLGAIDLAFSVDTLDNTAIPRQGWLLETRYRRALSALGSDRSLSLASFRALKPITYGKHTVLGFATLAGTVNDAEKDIDAFSLGGFLSLSGYEPDSLSGRYGAFLGMAYYYRLGRTSPGFLDTPIYVGFSLESAYLKATEENEAQGSHFYSGSAYVVLDTFIGPLYLAYGHAGASQHSAYLFLGQSF